MALNTYSERTQPRVLYGGPGGRRPRTTRFERSEHPALGGRGGHGSHMPLDTEIHWELRNPLNIIPAALILVLLLAIAGMLFGL
jgi:hypothetical protein